MKAVYAKGSRWALACVLALVFAAVVAIPVLATAGELGDKEAMGEVVSDKAIDSTEAQGDEKAGDTQEKVDKAILAAAGDDNTNNQGGGNDNLSDPPNNNSIDVGADMSTETWKAVIPVSAFGFTPDANTVVWQEGDSEAVDSVVINGDNFEVAINENHRADYNRSLTGTVTELNGTATATIHINILGDQGGGADINCDVDSETRKATIPLSSFGFTPDKGNVVWATYGENGEYSDGDAIDSVVISNGNLVVTVSDAVMSEPGRVLTATVNEADNGTNWANIHLTIPGNGQGDSPTPSGGIDEGTDPSTGIAKINVGRFSFTPDPTKTEWSGSDGQAIDSVSIDGEDLVFVVKEAFRTQNGRTLTGTVYNTDKSASENVRIHINSNSDEDEQEGGSGVTVIAHSLIYTGQPASGNVSVFYREQGEEKSKNLKEGTDFTVKYLDKSGQELNPAPSAIGEYKARVTGIGKYHFEETKSFTIYAANDIGATSISATADPLNYAYTGQQIVPTISIEVNGATLVQGEDFEIVGYTKSIQGEQGDHQEATTDHSAIGEYHALLKGKGAYTGENSARFLIVDGENPRYWTLSFKDAEQANPTVTLTENGATPPAVEVKDLSGKVRTEYTLSYAKMIYTQDGSSDEPVSSLTEEGFYSVVATYSGEDENKGAGIGDLYFYVSKPEHDLTKATVTAPSTFPYKNGESLKQELNTQIVLTLNGKQLKIDQDYYRGNDGNGLDPDRYSGTLGVHKVTLTGNANYPNHTGETYYGMVTLKYGVWNESAPAEDTRVDTATGVKAVGPTISENSTFEMEKWVTMAASTPTGAELNDATKKAEEAAKESGALDVQVYDVKLSQATTKSMGDSPEATTSTANLTTGLDVTLSFPVDSKYNGYTATITQIHEGEALPAKTVTVIDGAVSTPIDSLSEFVIAVDETAAADSSTDKAAATKATKSTTAKTGDMVLPMVIGGIVVIAIIAVIVLLISRRRSQR